MQDPAVAIIDNVVGERAHPYGHRWSRERTRAMPNHRRHYLLHAGWIDGALTHADAPLLDRKTKQATRTSP